MKTPAIPNERKSRKTTAAKAVPAKLETLSKRSAAKVFAPKTETTIKPGGFQTRIKSALALSYLLPMQTWCSWLGLLTVGTHRPCLCKSKLVTVGWSN